jgi:hypothetical protein
MSFDQSAAPGQNRRDSSVLVNLGYALVDLSKSGFFPLQYLTEYKAQPGAP